jgi:hypothetical protein
MKDFYLEIIKYSCGNYSRNTAAANAVVHSPSLFPSADWQIWVVLNM